MTNTCRTFLTIAPSKVSNFLFFQPNLSARCTGFYHVKKVFSRSTHCNILGVLADLKDPEIQELYRTSHRAAPKNTESSINEDFASYVEELMPTPPPTQLLWFSEHVEQDKMSKRFYSRPLPKNERITHCSVSDDYIVYSVCILPENQIDDEESFGGE